jgi:hypothetical protein
MDPVKPPARYSPFHRRAAEAGIEELPHCYNTVLPGRNRGDPSIS